MFRDLFVSVKKERRVDKFYLKEEKKKSSMTRKLRGHRMTRRVIPITRQVSCLSQDIVTNYLKNQTNLAITTGAAGSVCTV
jgi:hypothetical protein